MLRKDLKTDVIAGHGDQRKNLQLISRQPLKKFFKRFHKSSHFRLHWNGRSQIFAPVF